MYYKMMTSKKLIPIKFQFNNEFNLFEAMESISGYKNVFGLMTSTEMNLEYLHNHSGCKYCSPLVRDMANENDDNHITKSQLAILSSLIYHKFSLKWLAMWATFTAEYNPIENYNMKELTTQTKRDIRTAEGNNKTSFGHIVDSTGKDTSNNEVLTTYGKQEHTSTDETDNGTNKTDYGKKSDTSNNETINNSVTTAYGKIIDGATNTDGSTMTDVEYGSTVSTTDNLAHTGDDTTSGTGGSTKTDKGTVNTAQTTTYGKIEDSTNSLNATTNNSIWAFNSTDNPVPTDRGVGENSGNQKVTDSGTDKIDTIETRDLTISDNISDNKTTTYNSNENRSIEETKGGRDSTTVTQSGNDTTKETNSGQDVVTTSAHNDTTSNQTDSGTDTVTIKNDKSIITTQTDSGSDTQNITQSSNTANNIINSGSDILETTNREEGNENAEIKLERSGNIGVTTTQQMLQQERELWLTDYYEMIYNDIDSVIALSLY